MSNRKFWQGSHNLYTKNLACDRLFFFEYTIVVVSSVRDSVASIQPMTLQIQLFGEFRLTHDGAPIGAFNTPKLQLLLAYLLLHRDAPQARQQVAYRFWPDSADSQARTNLRNVIHLLRSALPEVDQFLRIDNQTLQWRSDSPFTLDVADFAQAMQSLATTAEPSAAQAAIQTALAAYGGELLAGFYDDWVLAAREIWQDRYIDLLEKALALAEQQRDYRRAIDYGRRLLAIDSLREETYAKLMQLYALQGDRATALRVYHNCATILVRELGVEPGPVTQGIYERLLNAEETQPAIAPMRAAAPLIGRQQAWAQLQEGWRQASAGQPRLLLITGEAGIGKTRLAEEFIDWAARQGVATVTAHCYRAGGGFALAPVQEWLRAPIFQKTRQAVDMVWQREAARLLPELLGEQASLDRLPSLTETWQRQRLFEALARLTLQGQSSLLLLLDDIQWCDEDTLDWLQYLLRFDPSARICLIATARQEELRQDHALLPFLFQLRQTDLLIESRLDRLSAAETATLVTNLAGRLPAADSAAAIYAETEGNPLFIVEMVRAGMNTTYPATPNRLSPTATATDALALPPKVYAVIEARLTHLSAGARDLMRVAAVIGRAFAADVLGKASESSEDTLVQGLDELWQHGIIREQGFNKLGVEAYDFSHDKIREVAYAGLSPMRRRLLHRRVAEVLENGNIDRIDALSHQIALHYERAGLAAKAILYYQRAARSAHRLAALQEAIALLTHAQTLLAHLPEARERTVAALALQIALGPLLLATKGYAAPEVEQAFTEAWELCQQVGDAQQRFQVLWGLGKFYQVKPDLNKGTAVAKELLALAQVEESPELLLEAYSIAGTHCFHNVALQVAKQYLDQSVALYDRQQYGHHALVYGQDPSIVGLTYGAWVRWCMGYPTQALRQAQQALALVEEINHPYSQVLAMSYMTVQYQFLGDAKACLQQAEATIVLTRTYGFTLWLASAVFLRGWALAAQNEFTTGLEAMQEGIDLYRSTGAELGSAYFAGLLAETLGRMGHGEMGIVVMGEAFDILARTQDRWCEAELYRLKGELLAQIADPAVWTLLGQTPEACLQQAVAIARHQEARWWELRALVSLCGLWQADARAGEAYDQLADCYRRFDEGHDLPLLQTVQAMLAARR